MDGPAVVSRSWGKWVLGGHELADDMAESGILTFQCEAPLTLGSKKGKQYAGSFQCVADQDPPRLAFDVINRVPMEQYIPGVLAGELYEGWHDAAFEAQAVAARSYALAMCKERAHRSWDVTDTASSQMYVGIPTWDQAKHTALSTKGQILTWDGAVVPGYFSSCCGGRAATAVDAVGPNPINNVPPLGGHPNPAHCQDAPRYKWAASIDAQRVSRAIRAWGRSADRADCKGIATVQKLTLIDPNHHGRPTKIQIHGTQGTSAVVRCVDLPGIFAEANLPTLSSGWVEGEVNSSGVLQLSGRGFGHGVGLCQYGAEAMAASAIPYQRIVEFYYPKATITTAWD